MIKTDASNHNARHGFSLIEMVVVLSTLMVAMGIIAACFAVTNASHSSVLSDVSSSRMLHDLSTTLRRDCHLASSTPKQAETNPNKLTWMTSEGSVEYSTNGNRLLRRYTHNDKVSFETWRFAEDTAIKWLVKHDEKLLDLRATTTGKTIELRAAFPEMGGDQ